MSVRSFRFACSRALLLLAFFTGCGSIALAQEYGAYHYLYPYEGTHFPLDFTRAAVAPTVPEACAVRNESEMTALFFGPPPGPVTYIGSINANQCGVRWLNGDIPNQNAIVSPQFATCSQFDSFPVAYPRPALCFLTCPVDQKEGDTCRLSTPKNLGCVDGLCANPVHPGTGNKFQAETDYASRAAGELRLVRYYNSGRPALERVLGGYWQHTYTSRVLDNAAPTQATYYRNDGRQFVFNLQSGSWVGDADVSDRLTELKDANQQRIGWEYYVAATEDKERYDASGRLIAITSRSGVARTLTLTDGTNGTNGGFVLDAAGNPTTAILPKGLLLRVRDHVGRTLIFGYDNLSRIVKITDPAGGVYLYGYGANNNLVSVAYPGGSQRVYHYNEPAHTDNTNKPHALTGITDENGARFATYKYDSFGRAIESVHHAGGADVNRYQFAYNTSGVQTTVTDPLGAARAYSFQTTLGVVKNNGISGPAGPQHGPAAQSFDANGNVASRTDWNGNRTRYDSYDLARNLETSRTEGLTSAGGTTPQTRTITTTWHPTFRLPTQITEPGRTTTFTHDTNGNVLTRTVTAGTSSRTWTYTYNANGSVETIDGPRLPTDVSDVTTYAYYANTATCATTLPEASPLGCRGQIERITNALGHITQITEYNAHGQPLFIIDPNGLGTTLGYDARQRLKSRSVGGELTSYDYDNVGQLEKVTLPDGSFLFYTYDTAHRLKEIFDSLGNRIAYKLDAMGNRLAECVFPAGSTDTCSETALPPTALQYRKRIYDTLNRLEQEIGAVGQTTLYGYDNQGNLASINGPLTGTGDTTTNEYDPLNRLFRVTQPGGGQVNYGYDALDQLRSVTDPRGLQTNYTINGLGDLEQQQSPDTGTTTNTYDAAGNLKTATDARGVVATYSYDALNRVIQIVYSDGLVPATLTYTYDQGAFGKGRLTSLTNSIGLASGWVYDQHGRVTQRTETIGSAVLTTLYAYEAVTGRLASMTYPAGGTLLYSYDANGRVTAITGSGGTAAVSGVTYHPFGRVKGWSWGNEATYSRGFDQDGRISSYTSSSTLGTQATAVCYDPASRIIGLPANNCSTPPYTPGYGYDNLDRLTGAILPATSYTYTYDAVGNRRSKITGGNTDSYNYPDTSNRLSTITSTSSPMKTYSYDAAGNISGDGTSSYLHDTRGRLVLATLAGVQSERHYNGLGQRTYRFFTSAPNFVVISAYDEAGQPIGQYTVDTTTGGVYGHEVVYLEGIPVTIAAFNDPPGAGNVEGFGPFYLHPDHLDTPRLVTDTANQVLWRWDAAEPFGNSPENSNPSGLGTFSINYRFPGQYLDRASNTHYNYFRDYDPGIGRYPQFDPIGLRGGINGYAYVANNPLSWIDPDGRQLTPGRERPGERPSRERPSVEKPGQQTPTPQAQTPATSQPTDPRISIPKYDPRSPNCYATCVAGEMPQCSVTPFICFGCAIFIATGPGVAGCAIGCGCTAYALCDLMVQDRCNYICNR
jgi:RHS repeat-associated protein